LGHPDNYTPANPMITPPHIVPEWYFLPFYAILRSIPDKLVGVLALGLAILSLFLVPFIHVPEVRSMRFRPLSRYVFWFFILDILILGWLGACTIDYPYVRLAQLATVIYFSYFFVISPLIIEVEYILTNPVKAPKHLGSEKRYQFRII